VIAEDFYEMGPLAARTVTTDADRGLDEAAASPRFMLFFQEEFPDVVAEEALRLWA
jgi:hypothetical protein